MTAKRWVLCLNPELHTPRNLWLASLHAMNFRYVPPSQKDNRENLVHLAGPEGSKWFSWDPYKDQGNTLQLLASLRMTVGPAEQVLTPTERGTEENGWWAASTRLKNGSYVIGLHQSLSKAVLISCYEAQARRGWDPLNPTSLRGRRT